MDIFSKVCNSNLFATPMSKGRELSAASTEEYSCEIGSSKYYALCGFGGLLSCGITHTAVTPLDLVKCRLQVNKEKYKSLGNGFKVIRLFSYINFFKSLKFLSNWEMPNEYLSPFTAYGSRGRCICVISWLGTYRNRIFHAGYLQIWFL